MFPEKGKNFIINIDEKYIALVKEVRDDVDSKELRVSGSAKFDKNLKLEEGKSSGAIRIEGNLDAAKFEASGSIVVGGDVNVDEFSTKITNGSFENIYGDKIYINSDGTFTSNFFHDVVKNIKVGCMRKKNE